MDVLSVTLEQYSANINEAVGGDLHYAELVRELRNVRYSTAELSAALTTFRSALLDYYETRPVDTVAANRHGKRYALHAGRATRLVVRKPTVDANRAKDHGLWEKGRSTITQTWTANQRTPGELCVDLPVVGELHQRFGAETLRFEHYRSTVMAELRERHGALTNRLAEVRDIVANHGWDGSLVLLSDGWKVGFPALMRYSSLTLKANEPGRWAELAVAPEPQERHYEWLRTRELTETEHADMKNSEGD